MTAIAALLTALVAEAPATACGPPESAGAVCEGVYRLTSNEDVARLADGLR
jgi:hypothetical protein